MIHSSGNHGYGRCILSGVCFPARRATVVMTILRPVICTLPVSQLHQSRYFRLPPSTRPDSHLRRARLPPRLMYSSITDLLRIPATASKAKSIHTVFKASSSPWRPFLRGLLAPLRWVSSVIVLFFCLFSCLNKPAAAMRCVYDDGQVYMEEKCRETLGNGAPVPNIHHTSFM